MRLQALALSLALGLLPGTAAADPPSYLDRAVVLDAAHRAVVRAGLDASSSASLAARSRSAGWLPQLSVRVARGFEPRHPLFELGDPRQQVRPFAAALARSHRSGRHSGMSPCFFGGRSSRFVCSASSACARCRLVSAGSMMSSTSRRPAAT